MRIENDVEAHLDRAIELINRTNQLNFVKRRLPEDLEAARRQLSKEIARFDTQAGLIQVSDKYGDYGYCGYFQVHTRRDVAQLRQFCFSCRILGMGVEAWVHQRLGKPALKVRGEVLSDPVAAAPVDWIRLVAGESTSESSETPGSQPDLGSVAARGGCNLWPLAHYFRLISQQVVGEFNTVREGKLIPLDHSLCLRHAITGVTPEALDVIAPLGYVAEDFESHYFEYSGATPLWIFSNWIDVGMTVYRHDRTGFIIPAFTPKADEDAETYADAKRHLEAEFSRFEYGETEFKKTLDMVFSRIPQHGLMFVLLSLESELRPNRRRTERNRWSTEAASAYPNIRPLKMADFIEDDAEILNTNFNHYDRRVYHRLFQHMVVEAKAHRNAEGAADRLGTLVAS